jgi:hypothetical protein
MYALHLLRLILEEPINSGLELSDSQREAIDKLYMRLQVFTDEQLEERPKLREQGVDFKTIINQESVARDRIAQEILTEWRAIMTPYQLERLERLSENAEFVFGGVVYALTKGGAQKRLGLSHSEVDAAREKLLEYQQKVNERTRTMEEDALKTVTAELSQEQKSKLDELLGEDLDFIDCNAELLVILLTAGR